MEAWEGICPGNISGGGEEQGGLREEGDVTGSEKPLTQGSPCRVLPAYARGRGEEGNADAHAHSQTLCLRPKPFHANMGRELPNKAVERVYARWFPY